MSHVSIEGIDTLEGLAAQFAPVPARADVVVKYGSPFVSPCGREWLIDTVVVDTGGAYQGSQHFYMRVKLGEVRLSIRLDPLTDPFKSRGVHESIAAVARWFLQVVPGSEIMKHDLGDVFR